MDRAQFAEDCFPSTNTDADLLYASLLYEEQLNNASPYNSESEEDITPPEKLDQKAVDLPIQEILSQLSSVVKEDKISKFNICRSKLWEGAVRGLNRKTFSPENKVSVKFTDSQGTAEGAVDLGGPKREFFTLAIEWMVTSQLFCGPEREKYLSCSSSYLADDSFFHAGQLMAMSIVHGGPGPRCFAPPFYDALTRGVRQASVKLEDVYDFELRGHLQLLMDTTTVEEARTVISTNNLDTVLELAGTLQFLKTRADVVNLVNRTAHWFVLERVHSALERFKTGLSVLGVLEAMAAHYERFKEVFCFSVLSLNADLFGCLFTIQYSEEGSNNRGVESVVLSHWNDFLQDVEENAVDVTFTDLLFFISGCREIPPCGLTLGLAFIHEPDLEDGGRSNFPKANACACQLYLPVTHATYDEFKDDLVFAFRNTKGYGFA